MGCINSSSKKTEKQSEIKAMKPDAIKDEKSDQIELDFISETESEDDKAMMVKEQNFGMEGFLRTFITLLENKTIVEWFVVSKTKKNLHVDLTWNLYNMKFEGDNIGSEDEPRVQKIVRPLEKLSVGKVVMVDVKESIDFKVNAIWKTSKADKEYLQKIANEQAQKIKKETGKKVYVDSEFPPVYSNIVPDEKSDFSKPIDFKLLKDIFANGENVDIFSGPIDPTDIVAGKELMFVASAVALMAELPDLIDRIFITKNINKKGKYILRICLNGKWKPKFVDQYLPAAIKSNEIYFTAARNNQLYPSFVEKLYAKILGSYDSVKSVRIIDVLENFTGFPVKTIKLIGNKNINKSVIQIKSANLAKQLIYGCFEYEKDMTLKSGLVTNRGYPILGIKNVGDNCFLRMRNFSCDLYRWKGDWSKESDKWTEKAKQDLEFNFEKGLFWMEIKDFIRNFNTVGICYTETLNEKTEKLTYHDSSDIDFLEIEVPQNTILRFLSIFQKWERLSTKFSQIDIGAIIIDANSNNVVAFLESSLSRSIHKEIDLRSGSYVVMIFSSGVFERPEDSSEKDSIDDEKDTARTLNISLRFSGDEIVTRIEDSDEMLMWNLFNKAIEKNVLGFDDDFDIKETTDSSGEFVLYVGKFGLMHVAALELTEKMVGKNASFMIDCSKSFNVIPTEDSFAKMEQKKFSLFAEKRMFTVIAKFMESEKSEVVFQCEVHKSQF